MELRKGLSSPSRHLGVEELTPDAFAPFGEVVQNPANHNGQPTHLQSVRANQDTATKWLDVTYMTNFYDLGQSGRPAKSVVNMFVCQPRSLRGSAGQKLFDVKILERHPYTPQTFIPLGVDANDKESCYLVIVAPTLPSNSARNLEQLSPPYPVPKPRRKRSLKERLLGARPNPFTNDFEPSTTPKPSGTTSGPKPKGPGFPDLANIKAFIARGDQAVTYGPGTWHAPMAVLGRQAIQFVVVQYANGVSVQDCQEIDILAGDGGEGLAVEIDDKAFGVGNPKARL